MAALNRWCFHGLPRPEPTKGEVLIKVSACGLNNTDVNTRSGWYSKTVTDATTGGAFDGGENDPHGAVLRSHSHAFKGPMSVE